MAEAYTYALRHTTTNHEDFIHLNGNLWGFLYEKDDIGLLGEQFIIFGKTAVPHLIKLLDDTGKVLYDSSREATLGNAYQYRIKDFAAFYLSKIKNISIKFHQDFKESNEEFERLKMKL